MSREPLRVVAFAGEGVFSPVLDSQVLMPQQVIGTLDPSIQRAILILTSFRHRRHPELAARQQTIRESVGNAQVRFTFRPFIRVPFEHSLWAGYLRAGLRAFGLVGDAPIIVHCRGETTAAAAGLLKRRDRRLRVLLDLRGAAEDELAGAQGWNGAYSRWHTRKTQRMALAAADGLNTVSHKLAEHLRDTGSFTRDVPRTVVGCCAEQQRFFYDPELRQTQRAALGLQDKFVVCYCGAMSHWQRPDQVAAAFAAIRAAMPDSQLLIVSREAEVLVRHLVRVGVPVNAYTCRAAKHAEVARYLNAADVGLLLRENTLTNRVASPVKFAEYLRCGVPVILTHYVGDFSDFVRQHDVGATVDFPVQAAEVVAAAQVLRTRHAQEGHAFRQRCSDLMAARFSWGAQVPQLIELYHTLAARPPA